MFGTAAVDDGKMPLMITSQGGKSGTNEGLLKLKALSLKYSTEVTNCLILKVLEAVCLVLCAHCVMPCTVAYSLYLSSVL